MATIVRGPRPPELEALIERRARLGHDLFDEVWEGDYHMAPAPGPEHGIVDQAIAEALGPAARRAGLIGTGPFNLGRPDDYRVPDRGLHRERPTATFVPTAALVVEIVSPDDATWEKLDFYAAAGVDEIVVVDPSAGTVRWLARGNDDWRPTERSAVLGIDVDEIVRPIGLS